MSWTISQALLNSLYLPGQEEAYWEATCSDGEPSAPLNTNPTQLLFSSSDKMMEFCRRSSSGITCKPLTATRGEELLTLFLEAFPARISAPPEKEPALMESDQVSGLKWRGSFAKYDRATSSWRTPQCSLLADLDEFSETWPKWGSMQNGECWVLTKWAPLISESASGLWQTPVADDAVDRKAGKWNSRGEPKLSAQVKLWPTPNAMQASHDLNLRRSNPNTVAETGVTGQLNPSWVEKLMGWPVAWTSLQPISNAEVCFWRMGMQNGQAYWQDGSWEDATPRVADGVASRADRIRALGNGQVPLCAATAWRLLAA